MTTYLGIDLAWAERARTGLAALDAGGRLVASTAVVTDDEIVAFVADHSTGPVVATIDAPLVVPNEKGRRLCETLVGAEYGKYNAYAHSSNRSNRLFSPPRGAVLAERLGWTLDPEQRPDGVRSVAIEVYPHPAMVSLFDLGTVIPYKGKRGRTVDGRRLAFAELLDAIERVCGETLGLGASARWAELRAVVGTASRQMHLEAVEDEIDAIFCAHLAWLWGTGDPQMRVLGDVERGYIVVPGPPRVPPRPRQGPAPSPAPTAADVRAELIATFRAAVPLSADEAATLAELALRRLGR